MSRRARMIVFLAGAAGLAVMLGAAFARMPAFGAAVHLYRTLAVRGAVAHRTANVVSSVNFDLRGLDTLGEETILIASVVGAAVLLRPAEEETRRQPRYTGRTLESTRLLGYLLLPVTLIIGFDLVAHGHLTPGGGFQGGVVIATGMFLLYVTDSYQALGLAPPRARLRGRRGPRRGRLRRRGPGRAGGQRRVPGQHHQPEGDVRPVVLRRDGAGPRRGRRAGGGLRHDRADHPLPGAGHRGDRDGGRPMSVYAYCVAAWLLLIGGYGIATSRHLVHAIISLSVAQAGTYVLLLAVGFQNRAPAPVFGSTSKPAIRVVDPVVQAMTLTDVVVSATVTALLLALAIQVHKRQGTVNPDELTALKG